MIWDQFDEDKKKFCALGVFCLNPEIAAIFGNFILLKAFYQCENDGKGPSKNRWGITLEVIFSEKGIVSQEGALLGFLPSLSEKEKKWLNIILYLKNHPDYKG